MTSQMTVYVVDDDPIVVRSVQALMSAHQIPVAIFGSAEDFLNEFQPGGCGCLITDLRMDGMNGLELQDKVKQLCSWLPVVIVTGYADVRTAVRSLENGAVTLIEKPYEPDELLSVVRRAFDLSDSKFRREQRLRRVQERLKRLTTEEREIMDLIISGATNKAISLRLTLGMRTIDRRRRRILEKMEVSSATELAATLGELSATLTSTQ